MSKSQAAWPYMQLRDIAGIETGVTLGRELGAASSIELPYLRVANVQDGRIDTGDVKTVKILRSEIPRYRLQKGDVLLTEGGDFDKLGRGAVWDGSIADCLHQNHIFRVRVREGMVPEFFGAYMASSKGRDYFLSCAKQTTNLASINKSQLSAMPVPVPSFREQQRIAEILNAIDEKASRSGAAINKMRMVQPGLRHELLAALRAEEVPIGDLGVVVTGSTPPPDARAWGDGVPFVTPAELGESEIISSSPRRLGPGAQRFIRLIPSESLLVVCIGFSLGKLGVAGTELCTNQQINAVIPGPRVDGHFLYVAMSEYIARLHRASGLEVTPIVNKSQFSTIRLPIPSGEQQAEVVSKMRAFQSLIDAERDELAKLRQLKQGLMDDLLTGRVKVTSSS